MSIHFSAQAVFVCEPNYLVGEVLTCVCPNPRLVLTAGTSSVVCVWVYHKKQKQLQLQHSVPVLVGRVRGSRHDLTLALLKTMYNC